MMKHENTIAGASLFIAWLFSWVFAFGVGYLLALIPMSIFERTLGGMILVNGQMHVTGDFLFWYAWLLVFGLPLGFFQYLLLRMHFPRMGWWILTTILGWALFLLWVALFDTPMGSLRMPEGDGWALAFGMLIGLVIGVSQWFILRTRLPRPGWWIPANLLGFGLAGLVYNHLDNLGMLFFGFFLTGVFTGLVLWWQLDSPQAQQGVNQADNHKLDPAV
ncbi:MAG: hypothetical protein ACK2UW_15370 [Anaerolineales bacterium]|jgi:hypothetical protein